MSTDIRFSPVADTFKGDETVDVIEGVAAGRSMRWLAQFIDDAPDRARFEAALEHRLLPVLGERPLLEVLEAGETNWSAGW